jgi:ribonuclease HII
LDDSKQIEESVRVRLFAEIVRRAIGIGIGSASEAEIDRLNILEATRLAMRRALRALPLAPDFLLLDALTIPGLSVRQRPIIKGDGLCCSIAAASIIAKVTRDRLMTEYHRWYPQYNFADHKGYSTPQHLRLLREHGPCAIHRCTYAPVQHLLAGSVADFDADAFDPDLFDT